MCASLQKNFFGKTTFSPRQLLLRYGLQYFNVFFCIILNNDLSDVMGKMLVLQHVIKGLIKIIRDMLDFQLFC